MPCLWLILRPHQLQPQPAQDRQKAVAVAPEETSRQLLQLLRGWQRERQRQLRLQRQLRRPTLQRLTLQRLTLLPRRQRQAEAAVATSLSPMLVAATAWGVAAACLGS